MNVLLMSYGTIVPPVLGFFVLTFIFLISIFRAEKKSTNILFASICFLGALMNADVALVNVLSDKGLALQIDRFTYLLFIFSLPLYIRFVHSFLEIKQRLWIEGAAYLFSLALLFFIPTNYFIAGFHYYSFGTIAKAGPVFHIFSAGVGFTLSYCLWVLLKGLKAAADNHQKNRLKYLIGGLGLTAIVLSMNILPVSGINIYPMGNFSFLPAIFLAFGVLKYDLFDMGAVIRKGTNYFILTGVLTLLYLFIISFFNTIFFNSAQSYSLLLPFLMAVMIVVFFNPIRDRVQRAIDNLFYRGKYDYQNLLEKISGEMASLNSVNEIRDLLLNRISSALQLSHIDLLMLSEAGTHYGSIDSENGDWKASPHKQYDCNHPAIRFVGLSQKPLDKASLYSHLHARSDEWDRVLLFLEDLEAVLLIPLLSGDRLLGIIALGQRKSGELFTHEDQRLLMTIANQSVTAMEHAWAFEKISIMNLELEKKVDERTAELRRALEEKERTQEQLIRSQSLAAIGQLVAGTAHELNNPLSSAYSLTQTTVESIASWDVNEEMRKEVLDDLDFTLREMRRAGDIVRSLLDLSRQTQTYEETVNIPSVIDNALRVLYNQYKKDPIIIERHYEEDLPGIRGNFANLGQVFINLIKNAIQALPGHQGAITLTARYDHNRDVVYAECRDTGGGIPSVHLKEIFNPFFTTKAVGEGTGLGLYISHEIIKRHGGAIRVESTVGKGTTFHIELPRIREKTWSI